MTDYEPCEYIQARVIEKEEIPYRECPNCGKTKYREKQRLKTTITRFDALFRPLRLLTYILNHTLGNGNMKFTKEGGWYTYKSKCKNCRYEEEKTND